MASDYADMNSDKIYIADASDVDSRSDRHIEEYDNMQRC